MYLLHSVLTVHDGEDPLQCGVKHCLFVTGKVLSQVCVQKVDLIIGRCNNVLHLYLGSEPLTKEPFHAINKGTANH